DLRPLPGSFSARPVRELPECVTLVTGQLTGPAGPCGTEEACHGPVPADRADYSAPGRDTYLGLFAVVGGRTGVGDRRSAADPSGAAGGRDGELRLVGPPGLVTRAGAAAPRKGRPPDTAERDGGELSWRINSARWTSSATPRPTVSSAPAT